jgi:hypothetical protein
MPEMDYPTGSACCQTRSRDTFFDNFLPSLVQSDTLLSVYAMFAAGLSGLAGKEPLILVCCASCREAKIHRTKHGVSPFCGTFCNFTS